VETNEKNQFIDEFKKQWKSMWRNRVDDKVRAEAVASDDYSLLFVDKGTVIIATRKFKLPDFYELLHQHKLLAANEIISPDPSVGGWRKFIKAALTSQNLTRRGRPRPPKPGKHKAQQMKKGGKGWLHFKR